MKFLDRFKRKPATEPPLPMPKKAPESKKDTNVEYQPDTKGQAISPAAQLTMPGVKKASENDLRLELGDFLHRIPAHLLLSGPHDLKAELRFDISDLSERIARGQTTISLAEIYHRAPSIFRGEILESDNIEVRFPWQKLAKLVNIKRPGHLNEPAVVAPELAEKLRSKKPGRAIKTGEGSADASAPSSPVLPGRGAPAKGAAWFSKTAADSTAGQPNAPVAPEAALPPSKSADLSSVLPPPLKMAIQTPMPPPSLSVPAAESASVSPNAQGPMELDANVRDLPEDIQRRFAVMKGDFERQISELASQRRSLADARDKANEELIRAKKAIDEQTDLLAREQTANSISRELVQRHQKEREEYQAQIDTLTAQIKGIAIPEAPTPEALEQIAALTQERDALLQQKTYLSSQLSEMTSRRAGSGSAAGNGSAQRQVEELQRRILMLEAAQKESAQVLQREKDSKGKVEKNLAIAERRQQESALHMEETKGEMRKEIEATFRKQIKELEDQIADAARSKPQTEPTREESTAPAWQAEALAQLEAEIEGYRERMKALIRERDEARAASPVAAASEAGSEQLQADLAALRNENAALLGIHTELENSRHRIAQLQSELSEALIAAHELASLRAELAGQSHTAVAADETHELVEQLRRQLDEQTGAHAQEIRTLTSEYNERIINIKSASSSRPDEALQEELANLRTDHAQASTLLAEVHEQLESARHQIQKQAQGHASAMKALAEEKEALAQQIAASQEAIEAAASAQGGIDTMRSDLESEIARKNAELAQIEFERATLNGEQQKHHDSIRQLRHEFETAIAERDHATRERDALASQLRAEAQAHEALLAVIDKDHTSVVQAKEQLVRQLAQAEEARRELEQMRGQAQDTSLQAENARLCAELDEARQARDELHRTLDAKNADIHQHEEARARLSTEADQLKASLQSANAAAAAHIQEMDSERTRVASRLAEVEESLSRISSERDSFANTLATLEAAQSTQTHKRDGLQAQLAQLASERDMLGSELSASRKQHQQLIASLDHERGQLVTSRELAEKRMADAEQEKAALEAERDAATRAAAELNSQLQAQAWETQRRYEDDLAKGKADLDSTRQLLAELQAASAQEKDTLSAKQTALEAKIAEMESAHSAELASIEQRFRDSMAAPARELEQLRIASETLRAELVVARKMHTEILSSVDREREQSRTSRIEVDRKLEATDEARRQMSGKLDEREQAIRLLEEKIAQFNGVQERHNGESADLRSKLDAARAESESLTATFAANEGKLHDEIAALTRNIETLAGEKQQLDAHMDALAGRLGGEHARLETELQAKLEAALAARDALTHDLEAERIRRQDEIAAALRERDEAFRNATAESTRMENELARTREQRDTAKREKDELSRRISQIADQQKRMIDDMAAGLGVPTTSQPSQPRPALPSVIEVHVEDQNVSLPRIRPVQIRPPQVKVL